jgi:hypothetical protein
LNRFLYRFVTPTCQACSTSNKPHTTALGLTAGEGVPLTTRSAGIRPRRHRWRDHCAWSADFLQVVGRTLIGRATMM